MRKRRGALRLAGRRAKAKGVGLRVTREFESHNPQVNRYRQLSTRRSPFVRSSKGPTHCFIYHLDIIIYLFVSIIPYN